MLNSVFRAYKLVRLPLIAIAVVAVGNLIGSAGFGLGLCGLPDYGYQGIAWSTFGSALLGLACNLYAIVRHGILTRASLAPWRWARRAMPYLFASLKVAITLAFIGSVISETVGGNNGIGFLMLSASARNDAPTTFAGLFAIAIMGVAMYAVCAMVEKRMTRWAFRGEIVA